MAEVLEAVGVGENSAVVLYNGADDENVKLSAKNLKRVVPLHWRYINMRDVLGHDYLVVPLAALERIQELWG
jgi:ribosomal protein L4